MLDEAGACPVSGDGPAAASAVSSGQTGTLSTVTGLSSTASEQ